VLKLYVLYRSCFCSDPCETLQSYKKRIEDAFNKTSLHATIEDVLVVPNYRKLLGPCITKGFARMHKEIHTQHQWRFFAVPVDPMFPLGCKTTFRAYSADQVVEFVKKPKGQCLSKVGRYTGLEPVTLFVRWYPTALCDPNRVGVEGLYILEKLPSCPVGMGTFIEPCDFDVGSSDYIKKCIIEVHRQWQAFDTHATILNDWNVWADTHAPKSDSAVEYVTNSRTRKFYNMPMRIVLFNPTVYMSPDNWLNKLGGYSDYDPNFKWPEAIAIAMNSVASDRFNPHPPEARVYSALDEQIVLKKQNFCDATVLYYDGRLKTATAKLLKEMLRRRVGYSGEEPCLTGVKTELINRIKDVHLQMIIIFARKLSPPDMEFVDSIFRQDTSYPEIANKVVASITTPNTNVSVEVSTKTIQELKLAQPLSKSLMNGVWKLFEKRDQRIYDAHKEVNDGKQHYIPFKRSYFIPPQFLEALLEFQPDNNNILDEYFPERFQMASMHRAYFLEKLREDDDCFCVFIADFDLKCLFYI